MSDEANSHLDKKLQGVAEEGCVDTRKFEEGTTLWVETMNSVYEIIFKDVIHGIVDIVGGNKFLDPIEVRFNGCTWGGSCLKLGHIGKGMHMEFTYLAGEKTGKVFTTTAIQSAKVVGPNNAWNYELWEEDE
jgi:hypothetical protein